LRSKEVTSAEFIRQCREFKVRDGLLKYCVQRGVCDKRNKVYYFPHNLTVTPRIVKFILDDRATYLKECYAKRKFEQKAEEQKRKSKESENKTKALKAETQTKKVETTQETSVAVPKEVQNLIDKNMDATNALIESIELHSANSIGKYERWVDSLQRELKQLDKTCLSYLDHIDILEERVNQLEKEKEEMREIFFQVGMDTIKAKAEGEGANVEQ